MYKIPSQQHLRLVFDQTAGHYSLKQSIHNIHYHTRLGENPAIAVQANCSPKLSELPATYTLKRVHLASKPHLEEHWEGLLDLYLVSLLTDMFLLLQPHSLLVENSFTCFPLQCSAISCLHIGVTALLVYTHLLDHCPKASLLCLRILQLQKDAAFSHKTPNSDIISALSLTSHFYHIHFHRPQLLS